MTQRHLRQGAGGSPPQKGGYRLIALDIDDTLLGPDKTIVSTDLTAIRRCMDAGIEVVLSTGRTRRTTLPVAEQIGGSIPIICTTGGVTYDGDGNTIRRLTIPTELARKMLYHLRRAGIAAFVDKDEDIHYTMQPEWVYPGLEGTVSPDLADTLTDAPDQIIVWGRDNTEWVIKHFSYLEGDVQLLVLPSHDDARVVHILPPTATKGNALADYCRRKGIKRRETTAFGDSLNDFSMLSYAGLGVAVADSEPRLRLVADKVMDDDETIADVLYRHVLPDAGT